MNSLDGLRITTQEIPVVARALKKSRRRNWWQKVIAVIWGKQEYKYHVPALPPPKPAPLPESARARAITRKLTQQQPHTEPLAQIRARSLPQGWRG
jgi:hypothetical protein